VVARMSGRALESIVEERVESGWNVGVAAFWAADPAGRSADAAVFYASGGVDPVQRPSPAAEAWGEACSKGRSQVDDRFLWRAAAHGKKTGTPGTLCSCARSSVRRLRGHCVVMGIKAGCNHRV
jgi:hypothetical protein